MTALTDKPKSRDALVRESIVFDPGNRFIQWMSPDGSPRIAPAYVKELQPWDEEIHWDDNSVVVEIGEQRFCVGQIAKDLGGIPIYESEKSDLAWMAAIVALEPNEGATALSVDRFKMLCTKKTDRYKAAAEYLQSLKWLPDNRVFTRNGRTIAIGSIRKVELIEECIPPFLWAKKHKLFSHPQKLQAFVDAGGGDTSARLITSNGTIYREGGAELVLPGTKELALAISGAMLRDLQYNPDPSAIMDAIADGSYTLQVGMGFEEVNFKPYFDRCLVGWAESLRDKIKQGWAKPWNEIGEVFIVGGSAPLLAMPCIRNRQTGQLSDFETATNGRFKVVRHEGIANFSQVINLYGMLLG